jgi:hypothetical protein
VIRLKRALVFTLLHGAALGRKALLATPRSEQFLRPGFEPLLWRIGTWRLWLPAEQARKHVPAYQQLLSEHGNPQVRIRRLVPDFSAFPTTDKASYVLRFSTEERCRYGQIPPRGVVMTNPRVRAEDRTGEPKPGIGDSPPWSVSTRRSWPMSAEIEIPDRPEACGPTCARSSFRP